MTALRQGDFYATQGPEFHFLHFTDGVFSAEFSPCTEVIGLTNFSGGYCVAVPDAARSIIEALVDHVERETCMHENTHRGGAIWEICDDCGAQWADDRGGRPEFKWPPAVERANAYLAAAPVAPEREG